MTQTTKPVCGRIAILVPLVPIALFLFVVTNPSSGFQAWNDVGLLFFSVLGAAFIGSGLSIASYARKENSICNYIASVIHFGALALTIYALSQ